MKCLKQEVIAKSQGFRSIRRSQEEEDVDWAEPVKIGTWLEEFSLWEVGLAAEAASWNTRCSQHVWVPIEDEGCWADEPDLDPEPDRDVRKCSRLRIS